MNRAVFLDRDGVLNEAVMRNGGPHPPGNLADLKLIPDTALLGRLKDAGFLLIVITNQPDVARHTQDRETVEAINAAIGATLPIDEFFVCWHDDADSCQCRKPKPGLFFEAAASWEIDLARSFMVGDRWRDIDAGAAAGCLTVLIDRNYAERLSQIPDFRTDSLAAAIDWILDRQTPR
jgi:D-glycero-D-manno-heptose 1,7-bisphosphate phosphatase